MIASRCTIVMLLESFLASLVHTTRITSDCLFFLLKICGILALVILATFEVNFEGKGVVSELFECFVVSISRARILSFRAG